MADQETITIGLETQNKVAEAIYLRWYRNGRRHPRQWNEMAMEDKEPWRRVAKDAIRTFFASPEFQTMLDDVVIDGRLELIRWPDGTATLRFQGIGNDIIDHDPNTCSNSMSDGIRSLAVYGKE